ncbi:MAG: hypothetical protein ARM1_0511 [Candidatus Micrarchaeota archaeon]|nr:MAG: hypothetical protein ARM1_0511 [Candidatus Micrarchaeota archaeon]
MPKKPVSLYDIEEIIKSAGIDSSSLDVLEELRKKLVSEIEDLVDEASFYAQYSGRRSINDEDIKLSQIKIEKLSKRLYKKLKANSKAGYRSNMSISKRQQQ